jgi:hypothetical protein
MLIDSCPRVLSYIASVFCIEEMSDYGFNLLLDSVESPKEGKGGKPSPPSGKSAKRKMEGPKKAQGHSPVNG